MTYEEAIKHFKSLQKRYTTEHNGKMCEKVALAIEALEKQIPKKPKHVGEIPVCSCGMNLSKEEYPYCRHCGQTLDWSDDEE